MILAVLSSCKKAEDVPLQYQRGGNSLVLSADGNLIIAGYNSSATKGYQATLVKARATNGDTIWTKTYGNSFSDAFFSIKKSNEDGYIATGFTNKASGGSPAMWVVKTDANGKELLSKSYGGSAYSQGFCIVQNSDSGYLVAGYKQAAGTYNRDIYLLRINEGGSVIWEKTIGKRSNDPYGYANDAAYGVAPAPDGGYFITGSLNTGYNGDGGQIFLMKVTSMGDSLWIKTYGTGFGYSITPTRDGNITISGSILEGTNQDVFLLKTDTAGKLLWTAPTIKTFGGAGFEYGASMIETSDGGFAITGITESITFGLQDVYLVLANSSGEAGADKIYHYGGADNDQGYGIVQMIDNGFCITGLSNSGSSHIFLNKVNAAGQQTWP